MTTILNKSQDDRKFNAALHILKERINFGKMVEFEVVGVSMFPFIRVGDKVFMADINPEKLRFGDIVVFKKGYSLCSHRYLYTRKKQGKPFSIVAKGDNHLDFDSYTLSFEEVVGKITTIIRRQRKIDLESFFWRIISYLIGILSFTEAIMIKALRYLKYAFFKKESLLRQRKIIQLFVSSPIRLIIALSYLISFPVLQRTKNSRVS